MRSKIVAALLMVALSATAGCAPQGDVDFWGNPIPSPTPTEEWPTECDTRKAVQPPPYDPSKGTRPPDITPGFSWIVFEINVQALHPGNVDLCVPVAVYAATATGEPNTWTQNAAGLPAGGNTYVTVTPITGKYMAIQYDPTEEQFAAKPPAYRAHVSATYLRTEDEFQDGVIFELACTIRINGAAVKRTFSMVIQNDETTSNSCSTTLESNSGWNHY